MSDVLYCECLRFVQEQSCGEWGDQLEAEDAKKLEAFVRKQIAEAREQCAKIAEGFNLWDYVQIPIDGGEWQPGSPYDRGQQAAAQKVATAIRALGREGD